jgi:hypothetical protein
MFTVETDRRPSKIEIEAVWGLGEAIVPARPRPTTTVDKESLRILSKRVVDQTASSFATPGHRPRRGQPVGAVPASCASSRS